jgi:hypothetical protein
MGIGEICGFRLVEEREGELELVLYYSTTMPTYGRTMFQGLFESFLYKRDVDISRFPPVYCPNMHLLQRSAVIKRVREEKNFIFCDECGEKTLLPEIEKPSGFERAESQKIRRSEAIAQLRSTYEAYIVRIKSFRRDRSAPRCYISSIESDALWSEQLSKDLRTTGIQIIEDRKNITDNDVIMVVDTPAYRANPVKPDISLIKEKFDQGRNTSVIRLQIQGNLNLEEARNFAVGDMRPESRYTVGLFDLVLRLYAIPLEHPAFKPLRDSLQRHWRRSLAVLGSEQEVFVSYAWRDESEIIVNEIDQAFQNRGIRIIRDKRDLNYKASIKEFMERIGRGKAIVVVISDKYLKSKNCVFELMQIAENQQFKDRIFPLVLSDANIYDAVKRLEYIKYWEANKKELSEAMREVSPEHLQGIREEIDLFDNIRDEIAKLTYTLQDMNTLTPDMHRDNDFQILFDAVIAKLEE